MTRHHVRGVVPGQLPGKQRRLLRVLVAQLHHKGDDEKECALGVQLPVFPGNCDGMDHARWAVWQYKLCTS